MRRPLAIVGLTLGAMIVLAAGAIAVTMYDRNAPEVHADGADHFKYGSIGAETERGGVPFWIWYVLPRTFSDLLPDRRVVVRQLRLAVVEVDPEAAERRRDESLHQRAMIVETNLLAR